MAEPLQRRIFPDDSASQQKTFENPGPWHARIHLASLKGYGENKAAIGAQALSAWTWIVRFVAVIGMSLATPPFEIGLKMPASTKPSCRDGRNQNLPSYLGETGAGAVWR